jgi:hypothetical protein
MPESYASNPALAIALRRGRLSDQLLAESVKPRNVGGHAGGLAQMGTALIGGIMAGLDDRRIDRLMREDKETADAQIAALYGRGPTPAAPGGPAPVTPGSLPPPIPNPEMTGQPAPAPGMAMPVSAPAQPPAQMPEPPAPRMVRLANGQEINLDVLQRLEASPNQSVRLAAAGARRSIDDDRAERRFQEQMTLQRDAASRATAAAGRENFGQPTEMTDANGQRVMVQVGNRGTIRPVQGYSAPPAARSNNEGPFAGTSMDAQYNNTVLRLAPRIRSGEASPEEQAVYQRAFQALSEGQIQFVNDPADPTGNRQVAVRVPRNMGDLPQPGGGQAPSAPQGMTAPVSQPGGPSGAVAPQGGAAVPAMGQDAMPTAPAAVPGFERMRAAPTGWQWRADGLMEPAPGGPADPRTQGLTEAQSRSNFFGAQMKMGDEILRGVNVPSNAMLLAYRNLPSVPVNYGASANDQMYFNAARLFAAGVLRKETGAAMTPGEVLDVAERFFPTPFDKPQVIEQKARARQQIISSLAAELPGGQLRGELPSTTGPGGRGEASPPPRQTPPPAGFRIVQ